MSKRTRLSDRTIRLAGLFPKEPWTAADLLGFAFWKDITRGLRAIAGLRHELALHEDRLVRAARADGWSWADVGFALRVTRQAAARRWARRPAGSI